MLNNSAMSYIKMIILILIIAIFVASGVYFVRLKYNEAKVKTVKTNLLLVQTNLKEYEGKQKINGKEVTCIGTKVSDMLNDPIISELLEKNVINSDEYDKYYVLNDSDLEKLSLEISNEKNSYYIVNYENYEVIISSGCIFNKDKVLYKLSDIQNENQ